jgi:hypothetical protein
MIILLGVKTGPLPPSYIQRDNMNMSFLPGCFERWAEQASVAIATISASTYAIHNSDPSIEEIGDPAT